MTSIINPDSGEYVILGNTAVQNNLTVGSNASVTGTLTVSSDINTSGRLVSTNLGVIDLESPTDPNALPALDVSGAGRIGDDLYVGGTLLVNGDVITLGNSGGSVTFNSNISSDISPSDTLTYDIGTSSFYWKNIYCANIINPISTAQTTVGVEKIIYIDGTTSEALSMDDAATVGSEKTFIVTDTITTISGFVTVTPTTPLGYLSFSLSNIGDTISLIYTDNGWAITSLFRTSINN